MTEAVVNLGIPVLIRLCVVAFLVGGAIGLKDALRDGRELVKSAVASGALMLVLAIVVTGALIVAEQFARWLIAPFAR